VRLEKPLDFTEKNPFSNQARSGVRREWFFKLGVFEGVSGTAKDIGAAEKRVRGWMLVKNSWSPSVRRQRRASL